MIKLGLAFALGFITIVLGIWMYSEIVRKETWFKFGEPNRVILYIEWLLGIISIVTLIELLF